MLLHQNGWETFEAFDFSSIITKEDQDSAMADVDKLIQSGRYFKNSPPFQTTDNVFGLPEAHWLKFRMSFIMSAFMYLGKEVPIQQIQSWAYVTSNKTPQDDRHCLWHTHQYGEEHTLSGIYYLHMPSDVTDINTCGTEFALNGVDDPARWISPVKEFHWLIYPGKTWHRPMPPQSMNDRYVIAVDMVIGK